MNTTLFAWPLNIEAILELSNARITSRRERAEEELKARVVECEERLTELNKEIDVFRRKEVCPLLSAPPRCCVSVYRHTSLHHTQLQLDGDRREASACAHSPLLVYSKGELFKGRGSGD